MDLGFIDIELSTDRLSERHVIDDKMWCKWVSLLRVMEISRLEQLLLLKAFVWHDFK
jgi:hypothetical protein